MSFGSTSYGHGSAEYPDPVAASEPVEVITQGVIAPDLLQTWLAAVDIVHPEAPLVFDGEGIQVSVVDEAKTMQLETTLHAEAFEEFQHFGDAEAERLVEGGEGQDYREVADGAGHSVSTLYRALERMGGILESDNGEIRFGSRKIAEQTRAIVESAEHHIQNAAARASQLVAIDERCAESSAFQQWLNEYAVEVVQKTHEGRVRVPIQTVLSDLKSDQYPTISQALLEGYSAWVQDGHDAAEFRERLVDWKNRGQDTTSKCGNFLSA